jgi:hypothetical protein
MHTEILINNYLPDISTLFTYYRYSEIALTDQDVYKKIVDEEISNMLEVGKEFVTDPENNLKKIEETLKESTPEKVALNIQQGLAVLRRQLLEASHSIFEKFLCHVLRVYLYTFPQLLKNNDKSIQYRDLIDLLSNNSILEHMVESEITSFSYKSLQEKKDYFDTRLKLKNMDHLWVYNGEELWKEIDRKRQAIVHKEEIPDISIEYLSKSLFYFQRLIIGISCNAQVYQGVPFVWEGFSDSIKKREEPKL